MEIDNTKMKGDASCHCFSAEGRKKYDDIVWDSDKKKADAVTDKFRGIPQNYRKRLHAAKEKVRWSNLHVADAEKQLAWLRSNPNSTTGTYCPVCHTKANYNIVTHSSICETPGCVNINKTITAKAAQDYWEKDK